MDGVLPVHNACQELAIGDVKITQQQLRELLCALPSLQKLEISSSAVIVHFWELARHQEFRKSGCLTQLVRFSGCRYMRPYAKQVYLKEWLHSYWRHVRVDN